MVSVGPAVPPVGNTELPGHEEVGHPVDLAVPVHHAATRVLGHASGAHVVREEVRLARPEHRAERGRRPRPVEPDRVRGHPERAGVPLRLLVAQPERERRAWLPGPVQLSREEDSVAALRRLLELDPQDVAPALRPGPEPELLAGPPRDLAGGAEDGPQVPERRRRPRPPEQHVLEPGRRVHARPRALRRLEPERLARRPLRPHEVLGERQLTPDRRRLDPLSATVEGEVRTGLRGAHRHVDEGVLHEAPADQVMPVAEPRGIGSGRREQEPGFSMPPPASTNARAATRKRRPPAATTWAAVTVSPRAFVSSAVARIPVITWTPWASLRRR